MKNLITVCKLSLTILIFGASQANGQFKWTNSAGQNIPGKLERTNTSDPIPPVIALVSETSIAGIVRGLEEFGTRHSAQSNRFTVANWILNQYRTAGISDVKLDSFQLGNSWQVNVVATIPGTTNPEIEIIIGAHYDSQNSTVTIAPGADDNASGTAATIEMARVLVKAGYRPNVTIRFIAFAAEEAGLIGSDHYAAEVAAAQRNVALMQNYDMIGYRLSSQTDRDVAVIWYPGAALEASLDSLMMRRYTTLTPVMSTNYRSQSDSWSFSMRGYKSVFTMENDLSPFYHSANDLSSKLDFPYAADIIRSGVALLMTVDDRQLIAFKNISGIPDTLQFGTVNIGYPETLFVQIKNVGGADPLTASSMTVNHSAISVVPSSFSVAKDALTSFRLICNPVSAGNISAELHISSNDILTPQRTIVLTARSQIGSMISLAPESIAVSLYSGHSLSQTMTIANTGGSDLTFNISIATDDPYSERPAVSAMLSEPDGKPTITPLKQPGRSERKIINPYETRGTAAPRPQPADGQLLDAVRTDQAFGISHDIAGNFPNTKIQSNPVGLFYEGFESGTLMNWDTGYSAATREITTATSATGLRSFHYSNDYGGEHFGGISRTFIPDTRPKSVSFYLRPGSASLANGYFVLLDDNNWECIWFFATQYGSFYINEDDGGDNSYRYNELEWYRIEFRNINWDESVFDYYVNGKLIKANIGMRNAHSNASLGGLQLYNYDASEVWFDGIDIGGKGDWITSTPNSGTIVSGTEMKIDLRVAAIEMKSGNHEGTIIIQSNDPARPEAKIPVRMNVTDAPALILDTTVINFGEHFVSAAETIRFEVYNKGNIELNISNATVQPDIYHVSPSNAAIGSGEKALFTVSFNPQAVGNFPGTLSLTSNDPVYEKTNITLLGSAVKPPIAHILPESLHVIVRPGQKATRKITITNNGESNLCFSTAGGGNNYALKFNGSTSYVECKNDSSLNMTRSMTVEAWIYPFDWDGNRRILQKEINDDQYRFESEWGEFNFEVRFVKNGRISSTLPPINTWHHVAAVYNYDSGKVKLFIDGIKISENVDASGEINTSSDPLFIGTKYPQAPSGDYFNGIIDEIRIWNIARTESDIQLNMGRELIGTETGLAGYWRFNEGLGSVAYDQTVNRNDGSLFGGAEWITTGAPIAPSWFFTTMDTGVCNPQTPIDIAVIFDATDLDTGNYFSTLIVRNNDPLRKNIIIPVRLTVTNVLGVDDDPAMPIAFDLAQNYPNPFNPDTKIKFALPRESSVRLVVYDIIGREVAVLVNEKKPAGFYTVTWDASLYPSGMYIYRIQTEQFHATKKMMLIK